MTRQPRVLTETEPGMDPLALPVYSSTESLFTLCDWGDTGEHYLCWWSLNQLPYGPEVSLAMDYLSLLHCCLLETSAVEGDWVHQALCEPLLTGPGHLVALHVLRNSTQDDLLHKLPWLSPFTLLCHCFSHSWNLICLELFSLFYLVHRRTTESCWMETKSLA